MGFFPKRLFRLPKRKRKPATGTQEYPYEWSEEELDEEGMHELEKMLSEHSGFIVLTGERLRRKEERISQLASVFRKTAVIPLETLIPLESNGRRNIAALMQPVAAADPTAAGPSQSFDSVQDDRNPSVQSEMDDDFRTASSRSLEVLPLDEHHPSVKNADGGLDQAVESDSGDVVNEREAMSQMEAVPVPIRTPLASDSNVFSVKEQQFKQLQQELESDASGDEEIPAALLSSSVHGDPDTATTMDTIPLAEMNDWNRFRPLTSFSDYQSPLPMKVTAFIDLQTQKVARSQTEEDDRSPQPRTPEKDHSTTDGLLFAVDSLEIPMLQLHSTHPSSVRTPSPECDSEYVSSLLFAFERVHGMELRDLCGGCSGAEAILNGLRGNKIVRDRQFRVSRMSISPNFPVNVWDDVAPTRLHAHLINVSMDQDHNLLPVMN